VVQAAIAGQGVAIGWLPLIDDLLRGGQLVTALDAPVTTDFGYYLVEPRRAVPSRALRTFRQWVLDEIGAPEPARA
jgi:DNA-binding transcriptional LysR family regulator